MIHPDLADKRAEIEAVRAEMLLLRRKLTTLYAEEVELYLRAVDEQEAAPRVRKVTYGHKESVQPLPQETLALEGGEPEASGGPAVLAKPLPSVGRHRKTRKTRSDKGHARKPK